MGVHTNAFPIDLKAKPLYCAADLVSTHRAYGFANVSPALVTSITTATLPSGAYNTAYSQSLAATGNPPVTLGLASGSLPVGLTLSASGEISGTPTVIGTFNFTVKAENFRGDDTKEFSIVITKANPPYTAPTDLTATYGDVLSSVALPTGWSWEGTGTVGNAGARTYSAKFTPTDTDNYNVVTDVSLAVTVAPKTLTADMLSIPPVSFNGDAQAPVLTVIDDEIGELVRNIDYTAVLTRQTEVGTYPVTVTGIGNYTGAPSVNFVITDINVSVLSPDRVIPASRIERESAVIPPVGQLTAEFTAGPNPIHRVNSVGAGSARPAVKFFRQGKRVANCELRIYDASGNFIRKIAISDNVGALRATPTHSRRQVGAWDLRDDKGRMVGEGSYVAKGVIVASDGKKENVSIIIGVR